MRVSEKEHVMERWKGGCTVKPTKQMKTSCVLLLLQVNHVDVQTRMTNVCSHRWKSHCQNQSRMGSDDIVVVDVVDAVAGVGEEVAMVALE